MKAYIEFLKQYIFKDNLWLMWSIAGLLTMLASNLVTYVS